MAGAFNLLADLVRAVNHPVSEGVRDDAVNRQVTEKTQDFYGLSGDSHCMFLDGDRGTDIRASIARGETPTPKFWW